MKAAINTKAPKNTEKAATKTSAPDTTVIFIPALINSKAPIKFTVPESHGPKTYLLFYRENIKYPVWDAPFISSDNSKTCLPSFNLLAGRDDGKYNGAVPGKMPDTIKNVCGTCNCNCPGCYAKKETRNNTTYLHYRDNTIYTMTEAGRAAIYAAVIAYLTKYAPKIFRIHDSGDFNSLEYMELWDRIAKENSGTIFYTYTKRLDLLKEFKEKHGRRPAFVFQLSTWPGICEIDDIIAAGEIYATVARFEYDDGTRKELEKAPHCPAVNKHGKRTGVTCSQCQHCARAKDGDIWAVYAHN